MTTNDGIPILTMIAPWSRPIAAPVTSAARIATKPVVCTGQADAVPDGSTSFAAITPPTPLTNADGEVDLAEQQHEDDADARSS